jgi:hypothetical protein
MYFNKDDKGQNDFDQDLIDDKRYMPEKDKKALKLDDTRKPRLNLKMINQIRRNYEARQEEIADETELIQAQYAIPVQPAE